MLNNNKSKYYFTPLPLQSTKPPSPRDKGSFINFDDDTSSMYLPYDTADILLVDDDPIIVATFVNRMKRYRIRSSELGDIGRPVIFKTMSKSSELLTDVVENGSTYGLILIDENLGPDNFTGTQCIKRIRRSNYNGAVVSISGSYKPCEILNNIRMSGSNGLIPKSSYFFSEVCKLMNKLTTRYFEKK